MIKNKAIIKDYYSLIEANFMAASPVLATDIDTNIVRSLIGGNIDWARAIITPVSARVTLNEKDRTH
jgi:hypothetical protein